MDETTNNETTTDETTNNETATDETTNNGTATNEKNALEELKKNDENKIKHTEWQENENDMATEIAKERQLKQHNEINKDYKPKDGYYDWDTIIGDGKGTKIQRDFSPQPEGGCRRLTYDGKTESPGLTESRSRMNQTMAKPGNLEYGSRYPRDKQNRHDKNEATPYESDGSEMQMTNERKEQKRLDSILDHNL
jgi:hypothetical protein